MYIVEFIWNFGFLCELKTIVSADYDADSRASHRNKYTQAGKVDRANKYFPVVFTIHFHRNLFFENSYRFCKSEKANVIAQNVKCFVQHHSFVGPTFSEL